MQVRVRHTPTYGVARLVLAPGEPVRVVPGAMLATSYGVAVEAPARGGFLGFLFARGVRGRAKLPPTTFTASAEGGWVDVAAPLPGDLHVLDLDGRTGWVVARGRWLATAATVAVQPRWAGSDHLAGAAGGFLVHVAGQGPVVLSCYGALDVIDLRLGELVTVDSGHVVAYADTVQCRLRPIGTNGARSVRSGAGMVFDFAGPGQVLTQTRSPRELFTAVRSNRVGAHG
ncbi:TIGR00266 family protein [Longimycelium tulufanense]|uniref:TIGR00266 family protein n=1 Tax=Longimycelium tulufanense TaxID=907463 RepID=A0A8J3FTT1_9PSEU|nr:TIGR00266 family protein [Longimycelium tulufanense]GGM43759.1 TIGR00266 family protein [Longimycelium tulufanense]